MAESTVKQDGSGNGSRRDFLYLATATTAAAGTVAIVWPLVDQMNPAANVLALASTEVDLSPIEQGMGVTVVWRGKPVFVRHRTEQEIESARADDGARMPDPVPDADRVEKPDWLVVVGICTHLGCVPLGTKEGEARGDYGGWFCPCHGSHYDNSGRIRKGPAPLNLEVPPYVFLDDARIQIG
ncbi:MAG: ubiquinol-cytochrome c reductase iron-sulfur subunit [Geminicoccaceae bacterium]